MFPVSIEGESSNFAGFLLQARKRKAGDSGLGEIVGSFSGLPTGDEAQVMTCSTSDTYSRNGNAVTHTSSREKSNINFVWYAPDEDVGEIVFV